MTCGIFIIDFKTNQECYVDAGHTRAYPHPQAQPMHLLHGHRDDANQSQAAPLDSQCHHMHNINYTFLEHAAILIEHAGISLVLWFSEYIRYLLSNHSLVVHCTLISGQYHE